MKEDENGLKSKKEKGRTGRWKKKRPRKMAPTGAKNGKAKQRIFLFQIERKRTSWPLVKLNDGDKGFTGFYLVFFVSYLRFPFAFRWISPAVLKNEKEKEKENRNEEKMSWGCFDNKIFKKKQPNRFSWRPFLPIVFIVFFITRNNATVTNLINRPWCAAIQIWAKLGKPPFTQKIFPLPGQQLS